MQADLRARLSSMHDQVALQHQARCARHGQPHVAMQRRWPRLAARRRRPPLRRRSRAESRARPRPPRCPTCSTRPAVSSVVIAAATAYCWPRAHKLVKFAAAQCRMGVAQRNHLAEVAEHLAIPTRFVVPGERPTRIQVAMRAIVSLRAAQRDFVPVVHARCAGICHLQQRRQSQRGLVAPRDGSRRGASWLASKLNCTSVVSQS